jgi:hypothetical protein
LHRIIYPRNFSLKFFNQANWSNQSLLSELFRFSILELLLKASHLPIPEWAVKKP